MRAILFLFVTACGFSNDVTTDRPVDALASDAAIDAAQCVPWSFMPADFDPCAIAAPAAAPPLTNGTYTIDSDTGILRGNVSVQLPYKVVNGVGVVSVTDLVLGTNVNIRGVGSKPLAIVAWGSITIDGRIDVSSVVGGVPGAGANPSTCGTSAGGAGTAVVSGDGGGGGGGYGAAGGAGGNGSGVETTGGIGGAMRALPAIIEGGCPGGNAPAGNGGNPGDGGSGGGAIALVAKNVLTINGLVHAGGAGGTGGSQSQTGCGGGGSGGMIRLESANIVFGTPMLAANGGQGGGGSDNSSALNGANGTPGATEPAQSNREGAGTDGGAGGWRDRVTGNSAAPSVGSGGGGGGGVGYIVFKGHTNVTGSAGVVSSPTAVSF